MFVAYRYCGTKGQVFSGANQREAIEVNDWWQFFLGGLSSAASSPIFALSVAFTIVAILVYHWAIVEPRFGKRPTMGAGSPASGVPPDLTDLRARVAGLESAAADALQNVGFVRFNAFADVGSELSYALAVLDRRGNGFVVSSIYSREEVRTYAKSVRQFAADKEMSNEEREALRIAKERADRSR
jgi:uncharacterized protein DUF4446